MLQRIVSVFRTTGQEQSSNRTLQQPSMYANKIDEVAPKTPYDAFEDQIKRNEQTEHAKPPFRPFNPKTFCKNYKNIEDLSHEYHRLQRQHQVYGGVSEVPKFLDTLMRIVLHQNQSAQQRSRNQGKQAHTETSTRHTPFVPESTEEQFLARLHGAPALGNMLEQHKRQAPQIRTGEWASIELTPEGQPKESIREKFLARLHGAPALGNMPEQHKRQAPQIRTGEWASIELAAEGQPKQGWWRRYSWTPSDQSGSVRIKASRPSDQHSNTPTNPVSPHTTASAMTKPEAYPAFYDTKYASSPRKIDSAQQTTQKSVESLDPVAMTVEQYEKILNNINNPTNAAKRFLHQALVGALHPKTIEEPVFSDDREKTAYRDIGFEAKRYLHYRHSNNITSKTFAHDDALRVLLEPIPHLDKAVEATKNRKNGAALAAQHRHAMQQYLLAWNTFHGTSLTFRKPPVRKDFPLKQHGVQEQTNRKRDNVREKRDKLISQMRHHTAITDDITQSPAARTEAFHTVMQLYRQSDPDRMAKAVKNIDKQSRRTNSATAS